MKYSSSFITSVNASCSNSPSTSMKVLPAAIIISVTLFFLPNCLYVAVFLAKVAASSVGAEPSAVGELPAHRAVNLVHTAAAQAHCFLLNLFLTGVFLGTKLVISEDRFSLNREVSLVVNVLVTSSKLLISICLKLNYNYFFCTFAQASAKLILDFVISSHILEANDFSSLDLSIATATLFLFALVSQ
jgi:hypothetical protein